MVDAALNIAAEQVIEHTAYGSLLQRAGNRGPVSAPQNVYPCSGVDEFGREDCWVAIAVATDSQWGALRTALGEPDWAMVAPLSGVEGRRAAHDVIDERLSEWCLTRTGDAIVETLWTAGVPVAKVMQPHRQAELAQLVHRRFFERVGHPVNAAASYSTLPVDLADGPHRFHRTPAPMLGEHNHEILRDLGLTNGDITALERDGVIGTAPATRGGKKVHP